MIKKVRSQADFLILRKITELASLFVSSFLLYKIPRRIATHKTHLRLGRNDTFFRKSKVVNCKGIIAFVDRRIAPISNSLHILTIDFAKGDMMNSWPNELLAECHRQRIREEVRQIYLERSARKSRLYRPGLFERTMFNVGNWMISIGKRLCKHYEVPSVKSNSLYLSK